MVSEARKESMAWMEQGLQISLRRHVISMEAKMAAGVLGTLRIMGETASLKSLVIWEYSLLRC